MMKHYNDLVEVLKGEYTTRLITARTRSNVDYLGIVISIKDRDLIIIADNLFIALSPIEMYFFDSEEYNHLSSYKELFNEIKGKRRVFSITVDI